MRLSTLHYMFDFSSFCVLGVCYLHIIPEGTTSQKHETRETHSRSAAIQNLSFSNMFAACSLSEAEYSSGPCNPLTVICSYQHSTEPTDTFKQSALFIKRVHLCKEGAKNMSKDNNNPLRWIFMFIFSSNSTCETGEMNPYRWNTAAQLIKKHM